MLETMINQALEAESKAQESLAAKRQLLQEHEQQLDGQLKEQIKQAKEQSALHIQQALAETEHKLQQAMNDQKNSAQQYSNQFLDKHHTVIEHTAQKICQLILHGED
jgi:hypothetical protein